MSQHFCDDVSDVANSIFNTTVICKTNHHTAVLTTTNTNIHRRRLGNICMLNSSATSSTTNAYTHYLYPSLPRDWNFNNTYIHVHLTLTFQSLLLTWCTYRFNIRQLYALPTLYLCVLYLSENKQRLVPLTS